MQSKAGTDDHLSLAGVIVGISLALIACDSAAEVIGAQQCQCTFRSNDERNSAAELIGSDGGGNET